MSDHVLSILVKALGAAQTTRQLNGVDSAIGRISSHARTGFSAAVGNIAKIGAVAAVGLGGAIKSGIDDLAALENATTSVDGAIRTLGLTGQITSGQVAGWANDIEADIGAAFDDKAITSASATLLRFGSVTPKNLRPAMVVMTDLAAKTGDVDSAASLLAKALADPTKAAGKLARAGVVLTKVQQDNIKALVKAGKVEQAQALLLELIAKRTDGAAAATQGPYKRALSVLADVTEDAKKALAEGFLPVLERVAGFLSKKLADPKVIEDIRSLGRGLADGFDKALSAAAKIPWEQIGDAMKLAGKGAKAALDLFTGLPPWVQTAVLTGWGLNKLTGGALGGIAGELGKGLIKGVLGMNAGVVNLKAGTVVGGGVPGAPGVPGAGSSKLGSAVNLLQKVMIVGMVAEVAEMISGPIQQVGRDIGKLLPLGQERSDAGNALQDWIATAPWPFGTKGQPDWAGGDPNGGKEMGHLEKQMVNGTQQTVHAIERAEAIATQKANEMTSAQRAAAAKSAAGLAAVRDRSEANRIATAAGAAKVAQATSLGSIVAKAGGLAAAAAIRAKNMSVKVTVPVTTSVSVRAIVGARTTYGQYTHVGSLQRTQF